MDTEELIRKCRAIRLTEEAEGKVLFKSKVTKKGEKIVAGCLIGKVFLNRGVNIEGLKTTMQQVWRTMREVKIECLGSNVFMFKFNSEEDKRRIMAGGPWHFNRALIVPFGIGDITQQAFTHASFWVQILNVPIMCMDKETLVGLGEAIGTVEEVTTDEAVECVGNIARLKINVDITKRLKKIICERV